jgi:hypothetical protein
MKLRLGFCYHRVALGLLAFGMASAVQARSPESEDTNPRILKYLSLENQLDALIGANDRPEIMLGNALVRNIDDMHRRGLLSATAARIPWADSYWPYDRGGIALRYLAVTAVSNFPAKVSGYRTTPPDAFIHSGRVNALSPAEKYDLLVGDQNWSLTNWNWNKGQSYLSAGVVPSWMGICHGWAAASISTPEPVRSIQVRAADGTPITFYPGDIRALASALWGHGQISSRLIGGRCQVKNPARDPSGRVLDPKCFDTNPGSWHTAIVNQIGMFRRPLIMDETYDIEVWNYPVFQYQYSYFNPQTKAPASDPRSAAVPLSQYTNDPFRKYRAPGAQSVVGIQMTVAHAVAQVPTAIEGHRSAQKNVSYTYDVELDAQGNIIGGEWYSKEHPDFTWAIQPNSRAMSVGDAQLGGQRWNGGPIPQEYTNAAMVSSTRGQPLAAVVETLVQMSAGGR